MVVILCSSPLSRVFLCWCFLVFVYLFTVYLPFRHVKDRIMEAFSSPFACTKVLHHPSVQFLISFSSVYASSHEMDMAN
nr:hypothetical protein CFP56_25167 [Quercus suber]